MGQQPVIQTSFNSGEWAPALNARVDLTKYHSGAALLRNFFVDYRGGATARAGTRFVAQSQSTGNVRLIPFQASFTVSYVLEFGVVGGNGYLGFYNNGAQVLSGGLPYTIPSPYTSSELAGIKFAQNVNQLILCHPNHPPYVLTLIAATNWTLAPITFGATVVAPIISSVTTTLAAGNANYAYVVTSVDANGQESAPSLYGTIGGIQDLRSTVGSNTIIWLPVSNASSYNVYKAEIRISAVVPTGAAFGFVGNATGTTFVDSNINPDFSQGPPIVLNPFSGSGVANVNITSGGSYIGVVAPSVSFTPSPGITAAGTATLSVNSITLAGSGSGYNIGDQVTLALGVVIQVTSVGAPFGGIITFFVVNPGSVSTGSFIPTNNYGQVSSTGTGQNASFTLFFGVSSVAVSNPGTGYLVAPAVGFSSGSASATATLGTTSSGNPSVPGFFQQRMVLAGPVLNPQQFNMSQTGSYFNYNINSPIEADDAIQGTLVSGQLNTIQSMIPQPYGLIVLSDKQAWLLNGGSSGSAITPSATIANSQIYNGASFQPPIVAGDNILYVQAKGSIVRNLVFNYYTQVYTGTDISVLSSHLFYGFKILEWAWAEEPFKVVWAVRSDGSLLSLTFLKEQELIAWAHHDTKGVFKSIATVVESTPAGNVDAIYIVVQRQINGVTVQYIERMTELFYPNGATSAWCVDAGIQYTGAPVLSFSGATQLAGAAVTGLATDDQNNVTVLGFTMPVSGAFNLATPPLPATGYTTVTVGLPYTPQLQTLALDLGEPTVQGKRKKITGVTARVKDTLGLSAGRTFASSLPMKDLVLGNVGSMTNQRVTNLVTGDARIIIDPLWDVPGQYCIQQTLPYPASILGVIPEIGVGDTK